MKPLCAAKQPLLSFRPTRWNRKRRRDSGFHWLNEYEGHYQNSCRPRDGILWHWVSQVTRAPGERPAGVPLQQRKIGQHGTAIRLAQLLKGLPLELADALTT